MAFNLEPGDRVEVRIRKNVDQDEDEFGVVFLLEEKLSKKNKMQLMVLVMIESGLTQWLSPAHLAYSPTSDEIYKRVDPNVSFIGVRDA